MMISIMHIQEIDAEYTFPNLECFIVELTVLPSCTHAGVIIELLIIGNIRGWHKL